MLRLSASRMLLMLSEYTSKCVAATPRTAMVTLCAGIKS
jgi:hypothetical protein